LKLVFVDRDGVINRFPGFGHYVTNWKDFKFLPRARKAIALLSRSGYEIRVISNQGCVARGLITKKGLDRLTERMLLQIRRSGGRIDGVHYCPHQTTDRCACKKPGIKLFKRAIGRRKIKLRSVYFIGDSKEDVEAAANLGCRSILVLCGRNRRRNVKDFPVKPDEIKKDLWSAAEWLVRKKS
jgi:histidinol-phosphate phosphatase family protein